MRGLHREPADSSSHKRAGATAASSRARHHCRPGSDGATQGCGGANFVDGAAGLEIMDCQMPTNWGNLAAP